MSSGPSLRTLFTRSRTGSIRRATSSVGSNRPCSSPGSSSVGSSQRSHDRSGTTTGIRSWSDAICSFGRVVMIENVRTTASFAGSRQPDHRPGERQRLPIRPADRERLSPGADPLPLVEPVDRHEAALAAEGVGEGRRAGERLGAGIEHPRRDLGIVGPVRDQAPAVRDDRPTLGALDDDIRLVGGRHVPARGRARRPAAPPRRSRPAPRPGVPG